MAAYPTSEIWGIALQLEKRLSERGIRTILDLKQADLGVIRKAFGVTVERSMLELRGISCIELEPERKTKQPLIVSRMFGAPIEGPAQIAQALSVFAQRATARMQRERSVAQVVSAFAASSPFRDDYTSAWGTVTFAMPTDDPAAISKAAASAIEGKLRPSARYVRAGVMLAGLSPASSHSFLPMFQPRFDNRGVGELLDRIHRRHGENAADLGLAGFKRGPDFEMRREMLSLRATTH